jgi:diguanylate cyclase (GGDEF)-like protein/PAS domain S-box-containing protein
MWIVINGFEIMDLEIPRSEKEMLKSSSWFLYDLLSVGVYILQNEKFIYVNKALSRLSGYSEEELLNLNLQDLISNEDILKLEKVIKLALKGVTPELPLFYTSKVKLKDQSFKFFEASPTLIEYDGEPAFIATVVDVTNRKKIEDRLKEREETLKGILSAAPIGISLMQDRIFKWSNKAMEEITGYTLEEMIGKPSRFLFDSDEEDARVGIILYSNLGEKDGIEFETRIKTMKGDILEAQVIINPLDNSDSSKGYISIISDITERKKAQEKLNQLIEEQKILLDNIEAQVWYLTDITQYGAVNKARADFFGVKKEELEYKNMREISSGDELKTCIEGNRRAFKEKIQVKTEEWVLNFKGIKRLLSITKTPKLDSNGNIEFVVCSAIDITDQREAENIIYHLTYYDELTNLYNRRYFNKELEKLTNQKQMPLSIIMIDVNGLKVVNDTYGHLEGDKYLKLIAEILKKSCKKTDVISRWGGDEFIILMPNAMKKDTDNIIKRIKERCDHAKFREELPMSVAIGAATKTEIDQDINNVIMEAESRMYSHKLTIKNSSHYAMITSLMASLKTKGFEEKHVINMREIGTLFGKKLGFSLHELNKLDTLITLHDIGKIRIPNEILTKPDLLTDEEYRIIQEHPTIGYRLLKSIGYLEDLAQDVLCHHEKWDGTGYPQGLEGEGIPYRSRVIAIIDSYEVMSSGRPYKKAMLKEDIIKEFKEKSGTQFDPVLAKKFIELLETM